MRTFAAFNSGIIFILKLKINKYKIIEIFVISKQNTHKKDLFGHKFYVSLISVHTPFCHHDMTLRHQD